MRILANKSIAAVAVAVFAVSAVFAQRPGGPPPETGQSMKGADIKGRAPVNKEILRVKLPKGQETTLSNGLRVILLENHRVPTFSMQMVVMSGGLSDPADFHGLASFTAAMLVACGTTTRAVILLIGQALGAALAAGSGLSSFTTTMLRPGGNF